MENNPYIPPEIRGDSESPRFTLDPRLSFLFLPPFIPFLVHWAVRILIPLIETQYLAMFTFGATIVAMAWSISMVDRLRLPFWKSYCLASAVCGAVLVSAIFAPKLLEWKAWLSAELNVRVSLPIRCRQPHSCVIDER